MNLVIYFPLFLFLRALTSDYREEAGSQVIRTELKIGRTKREREREKKKKLVKITDFRLFFTSRLRMHVRCDYQYKGRAGWGWDGGGRGWGDCFGTDEAV